VKVGELGHTAADAGEGWDRVEIRNTHQRSMRHARYPFLSSAGLRWRALPNLKENSQPRALEQVVRRNNDNRQLDAVEVENHELTWFLVLKAGRFFLLDWLRNVTFPPLFLINLSRRKFEAPCLLVGLGAFPAAVPHATTGASVQTPVPTHRAKVTGWKWRGLGCRSQVVGAVGWVVALRKEEREKGGGEEIMVSDMREHGNEHGGEMTEHTCTAC
jgi:hypothetical protein